MPVADEDEEETTSTSNAGTYRFNLMVFGLMNALETFQHAIDIISSKYTCKSYLMYLDDVIIFYRNHK